MVAIVFTDCFQGEWPIMSLFARVAGITALVSALSACTYGGGDIGNPLFRKVHWFSYVGGDDLRQSCAVGGPDRFRLVYNGIYGEQLRMYDLDAARQLLVIHVTQPGHSSALKLDDPIGPWRAEQRRVQLAATEYQRLVDAFIAAGMFGPPALGLELESDSYFWTAAYCREGRFGVTAWKYPSPEFEHLGFAAALFALDATGIEVAQPQPVPFDPAHAEERRKGEMGDFTLKVGRDGLVR